MEPAVSTIPTDEVGEAAAVPVAVDIAGPQRTQVLRVVEGALGWPVVAPDDPVLPPRCVLADVARAAAHAAGGVPVALVTSSDDDPAAAARAGRHVAAVIAGVPDAAGLRRLVARLELAGAPLAAPWCTIAAAAGGVGATTVATAIAGLRAWRQGPTLLATSGPPHQAGAPLVGMADLASPAVWAAAAPAVGLSGLRVVRTHGGGVPRDAGTTPLVLDRGVATGPADVLVLRPDRTGLAAAAATAASTLVVVGRGPVDPTSLRRAAPDRPVALCAWSARVAAAAAAGRLPSDLPGTWLRPLAQVVDALAGRGSGS